MKSSVFSTVVVGLFVLTSTFGLDDIDKLTGVDLEYMIGLCKLLTDQGYIANIKKQECNKKTTLDLIDLAIGANEFAKQKHPETASERDVNIAFLKNARKKWLIANSSQSSQSANNRLPSTPQPNKQKESSESTESDSDESNQLSQEISSPAKPPTLETIEHFDKKFMLHNCKGLKEFAIINGMSEDHFDQMNIIQLIDLAIQANKYAKQQDLAFDEVKDANIKFLESVREQWAKKRPDLLPKPERQKPGKFEAGQPESNRLPSRKPPANTGSASKPLRPGSQSASPNHPLHGHPQSASLSGVSTGQGIGRPPASPNRRPKPTSHLNDYSQEDSSNEHSFSQGRPRPHPHPRPRPGSLEHHAISKPGRRPLPPRRPFRRPIRRPLRPHPDYPSYADDQYSDYSDQQYYDYDEHQYSDDPDAYPEEHYSDETEEEQPVTTRPRPTHSSGGNLISQLITVVGKLLT